MAVKQRRMGANAQRMPSARDQQILVEVQALGRRQTEVAQQYGLSQSRVSQILKRVGRWRGNVDPEQVGEPSPSEQARLDQWLERRTLEEVRACAFRAFRRAMGAEEAEDPRPTPGEAGDLRSAGGAGSGDPRPTEGDSCPAPSGRAQGACVQWLKLVLKTVEMQWDLADRPRAKSRLEEEDPVWYLLRDQMHSARRHAEQEQRLPKCGNVSALVAQAMNVLYSPEIQLSPLDGSGKRPPGAKLAPCETLTSEEREARRRVAEGGELRPTREGDLRSERGAGSGDPRPTPEGAGDPCPTRSGDPRPTLGQSADGAPSANIRAADISPAEGGSAGGASDAKDVAATTCDRQVEPDRAGDAAAEGLQKTENISATADPARRAGSRSTPTTATASTASAASTASTRPAQPRYVPPPPPPAPIPRYAPPADYGYQKPIEDDAWREYMAERRREHLKALVMRVIER